MENYIQSLKK